MPFGDDEYYAAQGAVQVLSGGMGARLFTEVREKRGLCYSVGASYQTFKDRACILCYAGTTAERAQETLDVTLTELRRLADGVTQEEVRARAGRSEVVGHHAGRIDVGPGRRPGLGLVLPGPDPFAGRDPRGHRLADAAPRSSAIVRRQSAQGFTIVTLGPKKLRLRQEFKEPRGYCRLGRDRML